VVPRTYDSGHCGTRTSTRAVWRGAYAATGARQRSRRGSRIVRRSIIRVAKPAPVVTTPIKLSGTPPDIRHRAPTLGEHTDAILRELGCTDDEIANFRTAKVI
jgi:crotonobetainyl-CoA:carnitine CoA-transferase CaiB-like acyl-CoA transferase